MFRNPLEEQGGEGGCLHRAHYVFPKKKNALSVHYVPTTSACTQMAHRVQVRVACPSWGAPPQGPNTWVMEVVEMTEAKKAGLIALVQGQKCYITPAFSGIPKDLGGLNCPGGWGWGGSAK